MFVTFLAIIFEMRMKYQSTLLLYLLVFLSEMLLRTFKLSAGKSKEFVLFELLLWFILTVFIQGLHKKSTHLHYRNLDYGIFNCCRPDFYYMNYIDAGILFKPIFSKSILLKSLVLFCHFRKKCFLVHLFIKA